MILSVFDSLRFFFRHAGPQKSSRFRFLNIRFTFTLKIVNSTVNDLERFWHVSSRAHFFFTNRRNGFFSLKIIPRNAQDHFSKRSRSFFETLKMFVELPRLWRRGCLVAWAETRPDLCGCSAAIDARERDEIWHDLSSAASGRTTRKDRQNF